MGTSFAGEPGTDVGHGSQPFSHAVGGKAAEGQLRSEPDSGNPTVRDRRGACGTVARGAGLRPTAKAVDKPPDPNVHAPQFYPDPARRAVVDVTWLIGRECARVYEHYPCN